jgi:hypothetical protein
VFPIRRLPDDGFKEWELVPVRGYEGLGCKVAKDEAALPTRPTSWRKVKRAVPESRRLTGDVITAQIAEERPMITSP